MIISLNLFNKKALILVLFALVIDMKVKAQHKVIKETNSLGMEMVTIPSGKFLMGGMAKGENFDEGPLHEVEISQSFKMSSTEVTNIQYEQFDPSHKDLRGKMGFSRADDEAVVFVSYDDAVDFCEWLSKKENKEYRLPTEAEWEYACRAGTLTDYNMANKMLRSEFKVQAYNRVPKPVSLKVRMFDPNDWGLYDMHGNVEEWCLDWYGAYDSGYQKDPVGKLEGEFKVTRGGSHNTPIQYLRSANRMAAIPSDKSWVIGFRIVEGPMPRSDYSTPDSLPYHAQDIKQDDYNWKKASSSPVFMEPISYVKEPDCSVETPFYLHNHCPAITWCPNGDLLAIWFSTNDEAGREMVILGSRLRAGNKDWDEPSVFYHVPDRNLTGSSLFYDEEGVLFHINGVEVTGGWQNLAMIMRLSYDNGATWSKSQIISPEHKVRNQVIAGMFKTKEGYLIQPADALPGQSGGTAIHISKDNGATWQNPYTNNDSPAFKKGETGGLVAGIHAGVIQLKNGDLMALGRNNDIEGTAEYPGLRMPMSLSKDMGKSWTYYPTEFLPIFAGQRLVLRRLNEGAILLVSFTHHPREKERKGMLFEKRDGTKYMGYGMFAALSFDEGKTWPIKRLLIDGQSRYMNGRGWTGIFEMTKVQAEPMGYLAATQTPDNIIHLISSNNHYRFNIEWLKEKSE